MKTATGRSAPETPTRGSQGAALLAEDTKLVFRNGYEPGVQAARALAAALVVLVHMFEFGGATTETQFLPYLAWDSLTLRLGVDEAHGAAFGIFLFFLVSGYIVSQVATMDDRWTFFVKRVARLLPAMVLAVLIAVVVGLTLHALSRPTWYLFNVEHALTWRTPLEALGFGALRDIEVLFPLWTLAVEYYWYVLLIAFIGTCRNRPVVGTLVLQAALVALFVSAPWLAAGSFAVQRSWLPPVAIILVGRWIYLVRCGLPPAGGIAGAASAAGVYVVLNAQLVGDSSRAGVTKVVLTLIWATAVFCGLLLVVRRRPWRPIDFLAEVSYGVYLFHIPISWVTLTTLAPSGGPWMAPVVALSFVATLAVAGLSHRFLERPVRQRARVWLKRRTAGDRDLVS